MIKFGICRRDQLTLDALRGRSGRRRTIAVSLYPEIADTDDPDRDLLLEHILLGFSTAEGTFKRTQSHRFEAFDSEVGRILRARPAMDRALEVHDIAVSDGRTAVEFFRQLEAINGLEVNFLATDGAPDVTAISSHEGALIVIVDPDSRSMLQLVRCPFVFNIRKPGRRAMLYPVNLLVREALLRTRARSLLRRFLAGDPGLCVSRIRLISPECVRLAESDPRFSLEKYNVLDPAAQQFDLVRAMNIFNRGYFADAQLHRAVRNVRASLRDGGLLLTGSNQDAGSAVNGAIYERTQAGFRRLWTSGTGSQVDAIVLAEDSAAPPQTGGPRAG